MIYRTVNTDIWRDPWFLDLHPSSKCLFMYLFTNQSVSACGAMEISLSQIAFETKMPAKKVADELRAFGDKVFWLPDQNVIVVRNFYKHQRRQSSENFTKAAKKALADIPSEAQQWLIELYPELGDTHTQPIPNPYPSLGNKEAVTEAEAEAVDGATTAVVATPRGSRIPDDFAIDDGLRRWAAGKGFSPPEIEHYTEAFVSYWHAESGSRAAKKDWKQAWRTWLLRETPGKWRPPLMLPTIQGQPPPGFDTMQDWYSSAEYRQQRQDIGMRSIV